MTDKLPFLSDAHHYAIAAVATRSAQLDTQIEHAIWFILGMSGLEGGSKFILKNMNGDRYVGLLHALLLDVLPSASVEINAAFEQISKPRTERNEILHWLYGKTDTPDIALSASQRPFRERQERTRTAQDMQQVAAQMLGYVMEIHLWMDQFKERVASRYKPEPQAPLAS
jgi:hypothetical protein